MLAAAAAPSSQRVPPSSNRSVVSAVMITATAPKIGPSCMTGCAPMRSESIAEDRGEEELGDEEGRGQDADLRRRVTSRPRRTVELGEVVDEHRTGQAGAEAEREGAEEDGVERATHLRRAVCRASAIASGAPARRQPRRAIGPANERARSRGPSARSAGRVSRRRTCRRRGSPGRRPPRAPRAGGSRRRPSAPRPGRTWRRSGCS